jgi:hypothetical protein
MGKYALLIKLNTTLTYHNLSRRRTKDHCFRRLPMKEEVKMSALAVGAVAGALASSAARRLSRSESTDGSMKPPTPPETSPNKKNVGILAIETYIPSTFVSQAKLEEHSGVSAGRYTIGLGQDGLGVCGDCEDVNSLALTVVHSLLEK